MAKRRRHYTREFKAEAVRRVAAEGKSLAEVAGDLGLGERSATGMMMSALLMISGDGLRGRPYSRDADQITWTSGALPEIRDKQKEKSLTVTVFGGGQCADMRRQNGHGPHSEGKLLRSWPAPARLARGLSVALSSVGVAVQLHAGAPGDDASQRGLAVSGRTSQPASLPRLLAAKPVDLRVPRRIPLSTPPKSVTVSNFFSSGGRIGRSSACRTDTPPRTVR
jgi:hypothetical protein